MKNKIIKTSLALALMASSTGLLAGCEQEEVKEITETTIDTSTSIIPVEYSKELSKAILSSALANSLKETNVKSEYTEDYYGPGGVDVDQSVRVTSIYVQEGDKITEKFNMSSYGSGQTYTYNGYTITLPDENYGGAYRYYSLVLQGEDKAYDELSRSGYFYVNHDNTSYSSLYGRAYFTGIFPEIVDDNLYNTTSLLDNVIGGRYYKGKTYISAQVESSLDIGAGDIIRSSIVEYVIEDEKISSIRVMTQRKVDPDNEEILEQGQTSLHNLITTVSYTYGGQVIEDAPTSLTGYTQEDYASVGFTAK